VAKFFLVLPCLAALALGGCNQTGGAYGSARGPSASLSPQTGLQHCLKSIRMDGCPTE
jgi:hypothetical protein